MTEIIVRSIDDREAAIPLAIIVEKRKSSHPWADWIWQPVAVMMVSTDGSEDETPWQEMMRGEDFIRYRAGVLDLNLHRKDTEALRANLMLPQPELYVVLQEYDDAPTDFPHAPHVVSASAYDAQDFADAGDDIVEKVAMPEAVAAFIQAFVEEHHIDEEFIKRKRDKLKIEDQKFGKEPIFMSQTKH